MKVFERGSDIMFGNIATLPEDAWDRLLESHLPKVIRRVSLGKRIAWQNLVPDQPVKSAVNYWRRQSQIGRRVVSVGPRLPDRNDDLATKVVLRLPTTRSATGYASEGFEGPRQALPGRKRELDPIRALDAVDFSLKLKQRAEFTDALDKAHVFNWKQDFDPPPRDSSDDPNKSDLDRAKAKADVVGMLIERRIFEHEVLQNDIASIHCFSDGSPVVGAELQGMIAEIVHHDRSVHKITLPGSTLHYGHGDAINKCMAFLWALFLVIGPIWTLMRIFTDHVESFTTDGGIELGIAQCPDILEAFFAWINGRPLEDCRILVNPNTRLFFKRCLRIIGWNHTLGGIMKSICKVAPSWPEVLCKIQALCAFLRNDTWREYLAKCVGNKVPNAKELLKHFTATTAKWRFETMIIVMCALRPLREICSKYLREELYKNTQERVLVQDACNASRDPWFWKFIEYGYEHCFSVLEHIRRWGLICACCNHLRASHGGSQKHIFCVRNSRRLDEAWVWVQDRCKELQAKATTLLPSMVEDSQSLCQLLKGMCRRAADLLHRRFKYLGVVPWLLTNANEVACAAVCVAQIDAVPLEEHDPITRDFERRLGADLRVRAGGGECSLALKAETDARKNMPLNEIPGEGYHRETTHEKKRAPAASTAHLKRITRVKQVLMTIRNVWKTWGKRGRAVVRYEFKNWLRVLQPNKKTMWRIRRMKTASAIKRIYREDQMADEDWSSVAERIPPDRPVPPTDASTRESLEKEYLHAVLQPLQYYAVEAPKTQQNEAGREETVSQTCYFQVLAAMTGKNKEKTMHTVQSADDPTQRGDLIIHVLFLDKWSGPDGEDDPRLRVYAEDDAMWVRPCEIADFQYLQEHMTHYRRAEADEDDLNVTILSDGIEAVPRYPLTDPRTPTLSLAWYLRRHGWDPVNALGDHKEVPGDDGPKVLFDNRGGTRCKPYFMVLTRLGQCLPLSQGHVPSQEPQAYYKCLLQGIRTEAGLKGKHYALVFNRSLTGDKRKKQFVPIDDGTDEPRDRDGWFIAPIGMTDPRPPARRGGGCGSGRGRGSGSGGGRGVRPEPPPIAPPPSGVQPAEGEPEDLFVEPAVVPVAVDTKKAKTDYGGFKPALNGCRASYQPYVNPRGKRCYNFRLKCPYHKGCYKSRGVTPEFTAEFGIPEVLAYLHVWAAIPFPTSDAVETHAGEEVPAQGVRDFAVAHLAELTELLKLWDL